jgi:hypothetical protein
MDIAGWKTQMLSRYRHADSFHSARATVVPGQVRGTAGTADFGIAAAL